MENGNREPDGSRLKVLLKGAGIKSFRMEGGRRVAYFLGRTREWTVVMAFGNGWFSAYSYVCELPPEAGLRMRLLEAVIQANRRMSLTKFSDGSGLMLEVEYRSEHLDPEVLKNLLNHFYTNAEEFYPQLFRIVSGDEVLKSLEKVALPR